jgi:hypothetical protein
VADELLYRFEFPERPGALMRFLDSVGEDWNISLFHYRNHGADYGRVLDAGSLGVVFPFSSTRELAEQAVKSCKYPPLGIRGFGPSLAAPRWDFVGQPYPEFANENVMVIPIIEQKQAVENIDAIASVPGIDVLFIGASDLSYSLGVGGQRDHPLVQEALAKVLAAGKKYNVPIGYPSGNPAEIKKLIAQGFGLQRIDENGCGELLAFLHSRPDAVPYEELKSAGWEPWFGQLRYIEGVQFLQKGLVLSTELRNELNKLSGHARGIARLESL